MRSCMILDGPFWYRKVPKPLNDRGLDRGEANANPARLSRRFYEKFGDDLVHELVELLNKMDTTYRSELREINETNFARFEAKLEQRVAELRGELRTEMHSLHGDVLTNLQALKAELIKWMFLFWSVTVLFGYVLK